MLMETRCCKVLIPNYYKKRAFVPRLSKKTGKKRLLSSIFLTRLHAAQFVLSRWKLSKHSNKKPHATIDLRSRHTVESTQGQSASYRARPVNVDDGLEDIRWIRGLRGERLPGASYALLPNLKKNTVFCHRRGSTIFVVCFVHTTRQLFW